MPRIIGCIIAALLLVLSPGGRAHAADERCFPETGQCIGGRFREFWEQNGGLPVFGFPITPAREERNPDTGKTYLTQWFQRNRFELHPENAAPYDVLLGRLSDERLRLMGVDWRTQPRETGPKPDCLWFEQTGHNVCDQLPGIGFKTYWQAHGLRDPRLDADGRSLALIGLPLTEATTQVSPWDGRVYLIQWFERARFEWHPDEPDQYKVLLGLLGQEVRMNTTDAPARGQIAFAYNGDLYVTDAAGGETKRLTTDIGTPPIGEDHPVWSPTGRQIAFNGGWDLFVINADGSGLTRLTQHTGMPAELTPTWSPDGRRIAFRFEEDIYIANADGSQRIHLTDNPGSDMCPDWSPDGQRIVFSSYRADRWEIDVANVADGRITRLTSDGICPKWSPDGQRIVFGKDGGIYTIDSDGSNLARLTQAPWSSATWSPNGQQIAFTTFDSQLGYEIRVINADGSGETALSSHPAWDDHPTWSPDGAWIAFHSNRDGTEGIYMIKADGTGPARRIGEGSAPAWSPR